jgi:DHA2 family multidrug resistance protein
MMFIIMNNIRLNKKFPLYQLDWGSFLIYALGLCLLGYVLIYGQQYYWLQDRRIAFAVVAIILLFTLFIIRQLKLKRPYLSMEVFKYRNYKVGALLIFILYICRGALGVTSTYFTVVLGMDPIHLAYLMLVNMAAIILSVAVSSRWVVLKKPIRQLWIFGFLLLLIFHVWMCFLFDTQADASTFIIPLIIQGFGAGLLMTPIILFMISSVPTQLGGTASAMGVFFRFSGFCSSMALINYFQLFRQSSHYNRLQQELTELNPLVTQRISSYQQTLISKGMAPDQAARVANGLLNRSVNAQALLRFAMDYYQMISWLLLIVLLIIALIPYLNRTIINVKANQPAPVSY